LGESLIALKNQTYILSDYQIIRKIIQEWQKLHELSSFICRQTSRRDNCKNHPLTKKSKINRPH